MDHAPDNPLTTRVITNRIWQYHFGVGLVATASDFGRLGEPPSHPELLDWLTSRFVEGGWSFKKMHRLIMNSAAWRMSATHPHPAAGATKDPANRLRWRARVRRLEAEQIRDAALAISGELNLQVGGPSVPASQPRRSVYTIFKRNTQDPVLQAFDLPGGVSSTSQRNVTTTPTQALLMINGEWTLKRASAMARRIERENPHGDDLGLATAAYRLAYGQQPTDAQAASLAGFLARERSVRRRAQRATRRRSVFPARRAGRLVWSR